MSAPSLAAAYDLATAPSLTSPPLSINVPMGTHYYRFIENGKPKNDPKKPTGTDLVSGNICNKVRSQIQCRPSLTVSVSSSSSHTTRLRPPWTPTLTSLVR